MDSFERQLRQKQRKETEDLYSSMESVSNAVTGQRSGDVSDGVDAGILLAGEILSYYRIKPVNNDCSGSLKSIDEKLDYYLKPHGIMRRGVRLEKGWYKDASGLMLGKLKDTDTLILLKPAGLNGYKYQDPRTGKRIKINRRTQELIGEDATCFYRPLPQRKLSTGDLLKFMTEQLSAADVLFYVCMFLLPVLLGLLTPAVTYLLFSSVLKMGRADVLLSVVVFMIAVSASTFFVNVAQSSIKSRISVKQDVNLQSAVMARLLNLPASFFARYASGELNSRLRSIHDFCQIVFENMVGVGVTAIFSLLYLCQVFAFSSAMLMPGIMSLIVQLAVSIITVFLFFRIDRQRMEASAKTDGMMFAMLGGVQKIKLTGSEKASFSRWAKQYAGEVGLRYNPNTFLKLNRTVSLAVSLLFMLIIFGTAVDSGLSGAEYYALTSSFGMLSAAFMSLHTVMLNLSQARSSLDMIRPILEAEPEIVETKETLLSVTGNIQFEHVYFSYGSDLPNVVSNVSLTVRKGEYLAIIGTTGCGKSTLLRLMLGFESPVKGSVYIDGHEISKLDLKSLRRHFGVVMQDSQLFQGDIFSNITISAPEATLDDAWKAAEKAAIADDIRAMPMKMGTVITEGQGGISGGQKQRLMIARALVSEPGVLIFDEATSALDNITQKKVSDAIDKLGCTRIVVAHRLSTIRNADRIIVMDKGRIIEEGKYDELIAKNGFFAQLVARQRLDSENEKKTQTMLF